jgi:hypothetical protein
MARFLYIAYIHHRSITPDLFEELSDKISDGEFAQIDFSMRTLIYVMEKIEDDNRGKHFH